MSGPGAKEKSKEAMDKKGNPPVNGGEKELFYFTVEKTTESGESKQTYVSKYFFKPIFPS